MKQKVKMYGKIIKAPCYSLSYLNSYKFSGLDHLANMELPKRIKSLLKESNY